MAAKPRWLAPLILMPIALISTARIEILPGAAQATASQLREQGLFYRQQGRFPEAIAAFKTAVELEPQSLGSRVLLGWTQHLAGQAQEATTTLVQTLYQNPFHVETFNALGIVFLTQGDLDHAVAIHSWALILKPENEIAYYNLSLAYQRLQKYDWAIATAQRAAQLEPTNPHPLVAEAIAHWAAGSRSQAQQVYQQALALDSGYGDRGFLEHLSQAGFSQAQIQTTAAILAAAFSP